MPETIIDHMDELREVSMTQALTLQASLALQDAVAVAREQANLRSITFAKMVADVNQLPIAERLPLLRELYVMHGDLDTRMTGLFDKFNALKGS